MALLLLAQGLAQGIGANHPDGRKANVQVRPSIVAIAQEKEMLHSVPFQDFGLLAHIDQDPNLAALGQAPGGVVNRPPLADDFIHEPEGVHVLDGGEKLPHVPQGLHPVGADHLVAVPGQVGLFRLVIEKGRGLFHGPVKPGGGDGLLAGQVLVPNVGPQFVPRGGPCVKHRFDFVRHNVLQKVNFLLREKFTLVNQTLQEKRLTLVNQDGNKKAPGLSARGPLLQERGYGILYLRWRSEKTCSAGKPLWSVPLETMSWAPPS